MKVLRLFATQYFNHKIAENPKCGLSEHRYSRRQISRDFKADYDPELARKDLYTELGPPPEMCQYNYPPDGLVRIQSHRIVENDPPKGTVETWMASDMDLLSGTDMKAAQGRKPEPKPWV